MSKHGLQELNGRLTGCTPIVLVLCDRPGVVAILVAVSVCETRGPCSGVRKCTNTAMWGPSPQLPCLSLNCRRCDVCSCRTGAIELSVDLPLCFSVSLHGCLLTNIVCFCDYECVLVGWLVGLFVCLLLCICCDLLFCCLELSLPRYELL